ncbi:MAG: hypothetical protein M1829_004249 [Trizodia sp. TS-e1964]|nr:MAG: hypothetical protein M1829_004249 [Trizodia sp. TS-e1964]
MSFSESQLFALEVTERVTSVFSLLGTSFIITTFLFHHSFSHSINRLVFFAALGNSASNIATLISRSSLAEGETALCQFQAFLIQMFLPADACWTLAMALNVYLTFFRKYSAADLRRLEIKYILACYGIPFIPALVYLFVSTEARGRAYGPATLWCWIPSSWNWLRMATFYVPVWFIILFTFSIYIRVGNYIYQKRCELRLFTSSRAPSPTNGNNTKSTDIDIISEPAEPNSTLYSMQALRGGQAEIIPRNQEYSVTIRSGPDPPAWDARQQQVHKVIEKNRAAWAYTRCAFLFFVALLVTWVPPTINRVYGVVYPDDNNFAMFFASSLVLPLQGFWNSIIYVTTSLPACKSLWITLSSKITGAPEPRRVRDSIVSESAKRIDDQESLYSG